MDSTVLIDLWTTVEAEDRQQLTHPVTELCTAQLQAQRLRPMTGGNHDSRR